MPTVRTVQTSYCAMQTFEMSLVLWLFRVQVSFVFPGCRAGNLRWVNVHSDRCRTSRTSQRWPIPAWSTILRSSQRAAAVAGDAQGHPSSSDGDDVRCCCCWRRRPRVTPSN
uniref:(northern house mosquito) hypothetical protein n=1 Tax=Culex pipiens TaxID=7175 RepID=A0A8D8EZI0_CULPI